MEKTVTVTVWGRPVTCTVYQKSKTVWIATGSYMDHPIEIKDRSASAAVRWWAEAAKARGG